MAEFLPLSVTLTMLPGSASCRLPLLFSTFFRAKKKRRTFYILNPSSNIILLTIDRNRTIHDNYEMLFNVTNVHVVSIKCISDSLGYFRIKRIKHNLLLNNQSQVYPKEVMKAHVRGAQSHIGKHSKWHYEPR